MVTMRKFDQKDFAVNAGSTSSLDVTLHQDNQQNLGTLGDADRFTATAYSQLVWPCSVRSSRPLSASHTLMVWS